MKELLRSLWTKSALPVLLFAMVLVAGGIYLQFNAVSIQSKPIVVNVNGELTEENISLTFDEIDIVPENNNEYSDIQLLLQENLYEKAIKALDKKKEITPELNRNKEFILLYSRILIYKTEYELALEFLSDYNTAIEGDAEVLFTMGLVRNRVGDKNGAISAYRSALEEKPGYFEASFNLGNVYLALKRYTYAADTLEQTVALAGGKKRSRTLNSLGIAYTRLGNNNLAESSLVESINLDPAALKPRFNLAELYALTGRNSESEDMYNEILLLDELNSPAYSGLAELSLKGGDLKGAFRFFQEALAINPAYDDVRIKLAGLYFEQEDTLQAKTQLIWIIENGTKLEEALFQLGRIEYSQNNYHSASEYYLQAFAESGNTNIEALNNLGLNLNASGEAGKAKSTYLQALEIEPEYLNAHYNLGLIYLEEENYQKAETSFNTVLTINPDFPEGWYNLAFIFSQKGMYSAAVDAYEESLLLDPSNIKARLNLAVQYKKLDKQDMALEQYRLVLTLNPSYSSAWYNQALLYKSIGNYSESEKSYRRAVELNPDEEKYWHNLALLLIELNRLDDALSVLKDGIDVHPESFVLRYNLALQYKKEGNFFTAEDEFKRVVSLNNQYIKGWLALGDIQSDLKNHVAAVKSYIQAVELDPLDGYSKYQLGKEYYKLGNYSEALNSFENAITFIKDNAWIWYNLGKVQKKLGNPEAAGIAYNESLAIDPNMLRFIESGEETDNLDILTSMVKEDPFNIDLRIKLAELKAREGDYAGSLLEFDRASGFDPDNKKIWISKSKIALDMKDIQTTENAYKQILRLDPNNGETFFNYGKLLYDMEKVELSVINLEEAIKYIEIPTEVFRFLGNVLYDEKDYSKAIENFAKAVKIEPEHGSTVLDLGKAYYRNKEYENALLVFTKSASLLPEYEWSYIWLARAMGRLNMYTEAMDVYVKSVSIKPEFIQSYIGMGDLEAARDNFENAVVYYERALEIDPDHASTKRKLEKISTKL
jgi:tetratricopeptide (TPR) repeat protein